MRSQGRPILTFAGVAAVLALAVLGSAVGSPWELEERNIETGSAPLDPGTISLPTVTWPAMDAPERGEPSPLDLSWVRRLALGLLVLASLVFVGWLATRFRRSRVVGRTVVPNEPGLVLTEEPTLPVLQQGVATARRLLEEGTDPRDAIIAAWLALEHAAADSGVERLRSQTPTEFTVAVLNRTAADPGATVVLLRLYHRARFSRHASTTDEVEEALDSLKILAAGWDTAAEPAR